MLVVVVFVVVVVAVIVVVVVDDDDDDDDDDAKYESLVLIQSSITSLNCSSQLSLSSIYFSHEMMRSHKTQR